MKIFSIILIYLFLVSCSDKKQKKIDCDNFTMDIPFAWNVKNQKGIDSNVFMILTDSNDSIFADFGRYSPKFEETYKVFPYESKIEMDSVGIETKDFVFSKTAEIDQAQGTFLTEYYYYDTIDNIIAKIRVPKLYSPKGKIGISFDTVDNINRLTIYANKLSEENQKILLKSFKTIKFKNRK